MLPRPVFQNGSDPDTALKNTHAAEVFPKRVLHSEEEKEQAKLWLLTCSLALKKLRTIAALLASRAKRSNAWSSSIRAAQ
jgi:hypothetical protein